MAEAETSVLYHPAKDDLLAASRLHHLSACCSRRVVLLLLGFGVLYATLIYILYRPQGDAALVALVSACGCVGLIVILIALKHLILPLHVIRRQWKEQTHYVRWRENERVILLYQTWQFYQLVPKRRLPVGAMDCIRHRLQTAGVPKASWFLS